MAESDQFDRDENWNMGTDEQGCTDENPVNQ